MKWLDYPPVWLIAMLLLAWVLSGLAPKLHFGAWAEWAGNLLIVAGFALMGLAFVEFRKAKTTIIPGEEPTALITGGIYRYSRNPIYLGDVLVLAGFILRWDAVLALPLIPAFVWLIQTRFIVPEERRLMDAFGPAFEAWAERTRRWI